MKLLCSDCIVKSAIQIILNLIECEHADANNDVLPLEEFLSTDFPRDPGILTPCGAVADAERDRWVGLD